MTIALQVFVSGLAAGGVYGLFAAGHTLIYRLTGIVHFAFGDLVGLGIFATLLVLAGTAPVTQSGAHEPRFVGALLVGLVLCVAAGIVTYVGLVQPYLARGSTIGWVAGTVALAFGLVGALAMLAAIAAAPGEAVNANTGTLLGLKGLVAALAVRFGPPLRAFAAGLLLGVVEAAIANVHLGGRQLGPSYREV